MALDLELRELKVGIACAFVRRALLRRDNQERVFVLFARSVPQWCWPTHITVAGFVVGIACCVACASGRLWLATWLWWANRILDGLDGVLARYADRQTDFGGYVDVVADFTVYAALPLALAHALWEAGASSTQPYLWHAGSRMTVGHRHSHQPLHSGRDGGGVFRCVSTRCLRTLHSPNDSQCGITAVFLSVDGAARTQAQGADGYCDATGAC